MWSALFGSGWMGSALVAGALMCFVAGMSGFLFLITAKPSPRHFDEFDLAWQDEPRADAAPQGRARAA